jgi:putative MATE family efflux protein
MNNKNQQRLQRMGSQKMLPLIITFSLPSIISMTAMALYNVVDTIFVGRLGTSAIAGLTLIMPLQMFVLGFGLLIGVGTTSYISRSLGAKKYEVANHSFSSAIFLGSVIATFIFLIGYFYLEPIIAIMGKNSSAITEANEYGNTILYGVPIFVFNMILTQCARAEGNPNIAMNSQLVGTFLNIGLDPIFIFTLKMGIKGAALATVISSSIALIIISLYFIKPTSHLKFNFKLLIPTRNILGEIVKAGLPSFTRHFAASFVIALTNTLLAGYGAFALAIMGINNRFVMLFFMPMIGTSIGFMPIAGYNYGAKNIARVKDAFWKATIFVSLICCFGWLLIQLFPEFCIKIFSNDATVIAQGIPSLKLINLLLPLVGFQVIGASLYQAIGNGLAGFVLSIARQAIIFLPVVIVFQMIFGLKGIFLSVPTADFIAAIITILWLRLTFNQFDKKNGSAVHVNS